MGIVLHESHDSIRRRCTDIYTDIYTDIVSAQPRAAILVKGLAKRVAYHLQHKLNENGGFPCRIGLDQRTVVFTLVLSYQGFHRKPSENRLPFLQDKGMPKPPRTSIAI